MGCIGCTVSTNGKSPKGCNNNGGCASGGCNRLNTFDWLSGLDIDDSDSFEMVEVSFKNGARKNFYRTELGNKVITGDIVVVESANGYDIGSISLSGELVRLQMRKKKVDEESIAHKVLRIANERDMERLVEARKLEKNTMIRSRVIARTLGLEMKIGDVEYQGDKRKATFYYTADGRVDFRELIRHYAKEFRVKIEMRQIGARQESARIGGLGSCGRELCCSTWLTDFKSVSTTAARYQNLAINQAKLSGQCGRLKCCLNYELDTYMDALEQFPEQADKLVTANGVATLIKTDIFKQIMYYSYSQEHGGRGKIHMLTLERVKTIKALNERGEKPSELGEVTINFDTTNVEIDYEDVTGAIELPPEERKKRKKRRRPNKSGNRNKGNSNKSGGNKGRGNSSRGGSSGNNRHSKASQKGKNSNKKK